MLNAEAEIATQILERKKRVKYAQRKKNREFKKMTGYTLFLSISQDINIYQLQEEQYRNCTCLHRVSVSPLKMR